MILTGRTRAGGWWMGIRSRADRQLVRRPLADRRNHSREVYTTGKACLGSLIGTQPFTR